MEKLFPREVSKDTTPVQAEHTEWSALACNLSLHWSEPAVSRLLIGHSLLRAWHKLWVKPQELSGNISDLLPQTQTTCRVVVTVT